VSAISMTYLFIWDIYLSGLFESDIKLLGGDSSVSDPEGSPRIL